MIRLALIGIGAWGKNYLDITEQLPNCKIKYLCAKNSKTLAKYSDRYCKTIRYQELLKYSDIDGVIISTPASTHFKIARKFIKAKIPVLIEKPVTTNYDDAKLLADLIKKQKVISMVGYIFLFNQAFQKTLKILPNLGKIHSIQIEDCSFGPLRPDVSGFLDWSSHSLSMCLEITKSFPIDVYATGVKLNNRSSYDMAFINLLFKNKISAFIKVGSLCVSKQRKITIISESGILIFDELSKDKIKFYSLSKLIKSRIDEKIQTYPYIDKSLNAPLYNQLAHFIDCIISKKQPKTNMQYALNVMKLKKVIEDIMNKNR